MAFEHGVAVWSSPEWRARATAWVDERLAAVGRGRTGAPEAVTLRPWATVLRVPASGGPVWLKATARDLAFEVRLYPLLARVVPERVLAPLGVDEERGWVLLPDGGPPVGVDALAGALPRYAELQRALAPRTDALLGLGVSDMRPTAIPERFEEALAVVRGTADPAQVERVAAMRAAVAGWCERLAESPVPPSLDHNDLGPGHVLAGARFYDWGDAVVAHPFASMLALGWLDLSDAERVRLRDAYLEPFSDLAPHAALVEDLELACRAGKIARALVWHRAINASGPEGVEEAWRTGPAEALLSLLEDSWLGRA